MPSFEATALRSASRAAVGTPSVFAQLALRRGRNWAAQWHLAWDVGKRIRGCSAKRLYADKWLGLGRLSSRPRAIAGRFHR